MKCRNCGAEMKREISKVVEKETFFLCPNCGQRKHDFEDLLRYYREKVLNIEKSYIEKVKKDVESASEIERKDIERKHWNISFEYVLRSGKHIRSTLIILSTKAFGGEESKALLTAAAMEYCENWILVHDDIEDNSLVRRGDKTLHRKYGVELAINAGDFLHVMMWKILMDNRSNLGEELTFKLMEKFYKILLRTTLGQTAELLFMKKDLKEIKEEDFYYIADGKTGLYSIGGPLSLGAIISGREDQINLLKEFGKYLGRAFQIIDDVLDVTSDFRGLKERGNDIYEGKRTLLLIHLVNNCNGEEFEKVREILSKPREKKSKEEVEYIISLMNKYGSVSYARKRAEEFTKKALEVLERIDFVEEQYKEELRLAVDFILNRDH